MTFAVIRSPKAFSKQERLKRTEAPGRPATGRTSQASWVDSLAALRKCITLCWKCSRKFNTRSHKYHGPVRVGGVLEANADCDACREKFANCHVYMPIEDRRYTG